MNYGKALAVIRAAKGLQQKELAELLGVTSSYVSRIESGERPTQVGIKRVDGVEKSGRVIYRLRPCVGP